MHNQNVQSTECKNTIIYIKIEWDEVKSNIIIKHVLTNVIYNYESSLYYECRKPRIYAIPTISMQFQYYL